MTLEKREIGLHLLESLCVKVLFKHTEVYIKSAIQSYTLYSSRLNRLILNLC